MMRLLQEPLLHFLVLGAALFGTFSLVNTREVAAPEGEASSRCHSARSRRVDDMEHAGEAAVGLSPTPVDQAVRRDLTTRKAAETAAMPSSTAKSSVRS